jgi:hypothetical protein
MCLESKSSGLLTMLTGSGNDRAHVVMSHPDHMTLPYQNPSPALTILLQRARTPHTLHYPSAFAL